MRPVAHELPGRLHAREVLAPHHDPGVGLVVLEQDVVARLQSLDERILQQQGVGFAVDDDVTDFDDLLHQYAHLGAVLAALHEVGRHALAQALGLAHIDDLARAVHELVNARRQRQESHLLLEIGFRMFGHTRQR